MSIVFVHGIISYDKRPIFNFSVVGLFVIGLKEGIKPLTQFSQPQVGSC